jgi:hypothetical protein
MSTQPMKKSIEELLEKETPEQTEKERTEVLQELEIYFCKTAEGRRFWRKKGRRIKRYVMGSTAELLDDDDNDNNNKLLLRNTRMRY